MSLCRWNHQADSRSHQTTGSRATGRLPSAPPESPSRNATASPNPRSGLKVRSARPMSPQTRPAPPAPLPQQINDQQPRIKLRHGHQHQDAPVTGSLRAPEAAAALQTARVRIATSICPRMRLSQAGWKLGITDTDQVSGHERCGLERPPQPEGQQVSGRAAGAARFKRNRPANTG